MTPDTKTLDAPKTGPNTEALAPDKVKDLAPVTAGSTKVAVTVRQALQALAVAQGEHDEATREEGKLRQEHVKAQIRVGLAEHAVAAAQKGYDAAIIQARRAGIDPTERQDKV